MKNVRMCVVMVLAACVLLAGCGGGDVKEASGNEKVLEQADVEALGAYLVKNTEFKDYMSEVDEQIFYSLYNLNDDLVEDAVLYSSTGATAEEVAVIEAEDGKAEDVVKACEERIQAQKEGFENYVPAELDKLSRPVLKTYGNTVILMVCNDSDAAEKLIADYDGKDV
ncbi:DUF4358 domain-containing protein [Aminipila luticellarii]|uniref:DUF4358 domain-containing protein n=1 Tax=Aminipila luticellarii TaxID=2507160 RepID=A0A410PX62_9FIRM|nr:DUF4358 domain-containing protein [Aminipila luticellarii]QAT43529.1 DUF4358 domain-containing protein [Aminipila luticellarii]